MRTAAELRNGPYAGAAREEEFVRRAGFVLICEMAIHHKDMPDQAFLLYLDLIRRYSTDDRNFVKKRSTGHCVKLENAGTASAESVWIFLMNWQSRRIPLHDGLVEMPDRNSGIK
ncbi:MAG TPA: hypothetical protein O0X35_03145 [Methanocorpusculum sp.]|nr:hypothetical protein [Methanocorpusculum sp.]